MRGSRASVVMALLVIAFLLLPSTAQGTSTTKTIRDSKYAIAWFDSFDPSGCIETRAIMGFVRRVEKIAGGAATTSLLADSFLVDKYDLCTNTPLVVVQAFGTPLPAGMLRFGPQLSGATIHGSIEVCDAVGGTCGPVTINVTVTAAGALSTSHTVNKWTDGTTQYTYKATNKIQPSSATGSVSFGGEEFAQAFQLANLQVVNETTIAVAP
jgi:hypothetical protein